MNSKKEIEIRSDEVHDILSRVPSWMVRWGTTLIFVLILGILVFSWLIRFPEVIAGEIMLTTENPPIKLVAKSSGRINTLFLSDTADVRKGDFVAEIENPVDPVRIKALQKIMLQIAGFLNERKSFINMSEKMGFGDVQQEYNVLKKLCLDYQNFLFNPYEKQRMENLLREVHQQEKLVNIIDDQIRLASLSIKNASEKYEIHKKLYLGGNIARLEFLERENEYHQDQQALESLKKNLAEHEITLSHLRQQILETKQQHAEKARTFENDIRLQMASLQSYIDTWEQSYILTAPIDGKLSYLKNVSENEFVPSGDALFAVIPHNYDLVGVGVVTARGVGKISPGQQVRIKFDSHPYQEYGLVLGQVEQISPIMSGDGSYQLKISLPDGLTTTFGKVLGYTPEMTGTAEVVTNDLRLLERFVHKFRQVWE